MILAGKQEHLAAEKMEVLAKAVAKDRILKDEERLEEARKSLRDAAGEHALVDTAGAIAMFSANTIVVDFSGHKLPAVMNFLLPVSELLASIKQHMACCFDRHYKRVEETQVAPLGRASSV